MASFEQHRQGAEETGHAHILGRHRGLRSGHHGQRSDVPRHFVTSLVKRGKEGEVGSHGSVESTRQEEGLARRYVTHGQQIRRFADAEGGHCRRLAPHGEVATNDRDVVHGARVLHPGEHLLCDIGGTNDRVDDSERDRTHCGEVVDIGEHGGKTGSPGIGLDERRKHGLAAHDDVSAGSRHECAVVAGARKPVGGTQRLRNHLNRRFLLHAGMIPKRLYHALQRGHVYTKLRNAQRLVHRAGSAPVSRTAMVVKCTGIEYRRWHVTAWSVGRSDRTAKPRLTGLTHVIDLGVPIEHVRGQLDVVADYVDIWKFGFGTSYLDPTVDK